MITIWGGNAQLLLILEYFFPTISFIRATERRTRRLLKTSSVSALVPPPIHISESLWRVRSLLSLFNRISRFLYRLNPDEGLVNADIKSNRSVLLLLLTPRNGPFSSLNLVNEVNWADAVATSVYSTPE